MGETSRERNEPCVIVMETGDGWDNVINVGRELGLWDGTGMEAPWINWVGTTSRSEDEDEDEDEDEEEDVMFQSQQAPRTPGRLRKAIGKAVKAREKAEGRIYLAMDGGTVDVLCLAGTKRMRKLFVDLISPSPSSRGPPPPIVAMFNMLPRHKELVVRLIARFYPSPLSVRLSRSDDDDSSTGGPKPLIVSFVGDLEYGSSLLSASHVGVVVGDDHPVVPHTLRISSLSRIVDVFSVLSLPPASSSQSSESYVYEDSVDRRCCCC